MLYTPARETLVLDPTSPHAKGLTHCWLFTCRGGPKIPNIVNRVFTGSLMAGTSTVSFSNGGMDVAVIVGSITSFITARGFAVADNAFSVRLIGTRTGSGAMPLVYKSDNNTDDGFWIDYRDNAGQELGFAVVGDTNARAYTKTDMPPIGRRFDMLCTWDRGATAQAVKLYFSGIEASSYSTRTAIGATHATDLGDPLMIAVGSSGTSVAFTASFRFESLTIWNRALGAREARMLGVDPYRMFK